MAHSKRRETWALYAVVSCLMLMGKASLLHAKVWPIAASEKLESEAQEALLLAEPGDTVLLPAGRFVMNQELSITKPSITLKGQGMEQTRLVYGAEAGGAQAIISYADASSIEDLAIEDHPGDGVKIIGAKGASIRRVKVEWTKRGSKSNGAYGLYPVESSNILLEDNVVIGASDSGIYVGQSHDIIVRRNQVEYNVAGIEIENSQRADVYDNTATHNTGGILVFNLPNLMVQGGKGTRIFQNSIQNNNFENFAPKGNSVATVPQGTGILILSNDDIEIFKNTIIDHNTTSIAIASYSITVRAIENANFDAVVTHISIHDNIFRKAGGLAFIGANPLGLLAAALSLPYKIPHITYDGIGESDGKGGFKAAQLSGRDRICISANDYDGSHNAYFGNMQLWTRRWWSPIPGSMNRDLAPHSCSHPPLPAVNLPENPPVLTIDSDKPSQETIMRLCEASPEGINWNALHVDCPLLSQYNLFADPHNPLSQPREGGFTYDLNTPLFSDYASKDRVLFLAPGTSATYQANAPLDLPIGTVIAKTFYFPSDLRDKNSSKHIVETRLLIHRAKSWQALSYQWNSSDGTAKLIRGGTAVPLAWI
ncbi:MAG: right-handed parallel beta-helix repeat-containing protein, partial [Proteobacteria bacterium]|nr:right-handed parallel beta-helix repeat-containing protein [Pseudomonadota bacterium]